MKACIRAACLLLSGLIALLGPLTAEAQTPSPSAAGSTIGGAELTVAIKAAAPFAYKLQDGTWSGLSIDLWRRMADQAGFRYRLVEVPTVQEQLEGVAAGRFDAATAAISVTADRENIVDFTHPFYEAGLGIAVSVNHAPSWRPILNALTSFGFLQAITALIGISLLVGVLIWLFERRQNEDFGGGPVKGLFNSLWWSAIAATQASTGNVEPRTVPGRALALVWMMASIIAIAVFTAGVTSVLTVNQIEGLVQGEADLASARVGNVENSSTVAYLDEARIEHEGFATLQEGLNALRAGSIDAFVYDKPLLGWTVGQSFPSLRVLPVSFDNQDYAIALPSGSPLREPLNIALLQALSSDWWGQAVFQYLGEK